MGHGFLIDGGALKLTAQVAGHHARKLTQIAHAPQLLELIVVVLKSKAVLPQLFLQLGGLLFVVVGLGLFDKGQHVAHAQDTGGHAVGVEGLNHIQLFAGAHELDGLAGGGSDGEGGAAPGVTVQFGEDDAVDPQGLVKGGGGVYRVLAGHGVHHQQNLVGMDSGLHPLQLVHQCLIHVETAGGIQKHHVAAVIFGVADGVFSNLHRVSLALFKHGQLQLTAHDLQLLDGCGTVHVAGGQQGPLRVLPAHQASQFSGGGGLTGALEAHHHDHRGTVVGHGQLGGAAAHQIRQFLVDDLDDLLGGGQAVQHVGADGPLRDGGHEFLDHLVADVGLQQGQADLPHSLPDVVFRQTALAPQTLERRIQFFRESFKCHNLFLQGVGFCRNQVGQLREPVVLILAVIDGLDLSGGGLNGVQMRTLGLKPLDDAGLVLDLLHGGLRPNDNIPDTLSGDARVFRDLRQREVFIVIEIEEFLLPVGEEFSVKIEEHGHAVSLIFQGTSSFCKAENLYNEK